MLFEKPSLHELLSESDVEQKLVYPLLTGESPAAFAFPTVNILTKQNVKRIMIGKGNEQKSYFPDFLYVRAGLPLLVVEVKKRGVDVKQAFREARLYAAEMNAAFSSGLNPAAKVIATNGDVILAGRFDQAEPVYQVAFDEIDVYCEAFSKLQSFVCESALAADYANLVKKIKPLRYFKPRRQLGGSAVQSDVLGFNTFGATVSTAFAHVFNPVLRSDRNYVAKEGYVPSRRREGYIDPIDQVIRAATPESHAEATLVADTSAPIEINKAFSEPKQLEHQVLLIIGGAGAGKTTFVDRLQVTSLSPDVREKTVWVHINMNAAPAVPGEIYDFLRKEIIEGLRNCYPSIEFDALANMKSLYAVEVNAFNKGVGELFTKGSPEYNERLADLLSRIDENLHLKAQCHCRFLGTERAKLVVIVLDNCDKLKLDLQLLMFEAAQWVQKEFRALVILPLREETYDNFKDRPPLDTALKDLVFRIEPPAFQHVLVSRIQLALDQISKTQPKAHRFNLPNGFKVQYAASDQAYYLTSIVSSIFEYDEQIRRLIDGLSGKNLRLAFEIFLDFCKSGHIPEDQIVMIKQRKGEHILPLNVVLAVLLRGKFRFYESDRSALKSLVDIDTKDELPHNFARLVLLRWLKAHFGKSGPTGLKGYFPVHAIQAALAAYGLESFVVLREMSYLVKARCVTTEDFRLTGLTEQDLVKLAPAGFVHLDLLENPYYVAAIAEDMEFEDEHLSREIAVRIGDVKSHFEQKTALYNAKAVLSYLKKRRSAQSSSVDALLNVSEFGDLTDLRSIEAGVGRLERSLTQGRWVGVLDRYSVGQVLRGRVFNLVDFGLFIEVEPGVNGLLHRSKLPHRFSTDDRYAIGELVDVKIISMDPVSRKLELRLAESS